HAEWHARNTVPERRGRGVYRQRQLRPPRGYLLYSVDAPGETFGPFPPSGRLQVCRFFGEGGQQPEEKNKWERDGLLKRILEWTAKIICGNSDLEAELPAEYQSELHTQSRDAAQRGV